VRKEKEREWKRKKGRGRERLEPTLLFGSSFFRREMCLPACAWLISHIYVT
jgi:hypothetical protein